MDSLTIEARPREERGRHVHALRRHGRIPVVVYGHRQESLPLATDERSLDRIWHRAGRTHLIDLVIDGQRPRKVLIRDLQRHPRTGRLLHADFFAVNLLEKLTADIPLVVVGDAPAVTDTKVGQLLQTVNSIRVECLPSDLPPQFTVDVSSLVEVDQSITLRQVVLPEGVTLVHGDLDEVVVKVAPLRVREELPEEAAAGEEAAEGAPAEEAAPAAGEEAPGTE